LFDLLKRCSLAGFFVRQGNESSPRWSGFNDREVVDQNLIKTWSAEGAALKLFLPSMAKSLDIAVPSALRAD
jgi:hypothetical protein